MVDSYLEELRSILALFEADQRSPSTIECKHFFSGAAAYADGRIFISLTPAGLALKLVAAGRDATALLPESAGEEGLRAAARLDAQRRGRPRTMDRRQHGALRNTAAAPAACGSQDRAARLTHEPPGNSFSVRLRCPAGLTTR